MEPPDEKRVRTLSERRPRARPGSLTPFGSTTRLAPDVTSIHPRLELISHMSRASATSRIGPRRGHRRAPGLCILLAAAGSVALAATPVGASGEDGSSLDRARDFGKQRTLPCPDAGAPTGRYGIQNRTVSLQNEARNCTAIGRKPLHRGIALCNLS